MNSKMSVPRALAIIDKHVPPKPVPKAKSKAGYRSERDFPPNPTLPAFYVQYRDGPSPYDTHRGDYQESAADMWERTVNFDLARNGVKVPRDALGPRKAQDLMDEVAVGGIETVAKSNYFQMQVMPEEVHLNPIGTQRANAKLYNPARDRQCVERDLERDRTETFFLHLRRKKAGLYKSCLRNYPHGALGLVESPYGDPGEIYVDQQRRLEEARRKAEHTMRGQAEVPRDHMHGSNQMIGEQHVRGRVHNAPNDNLFASTIMSTQQDEPSPLPPGERYVRFRSQKVPNVHLLGGVLLENESPHVRCSDW